MLEFNIEIRICDRVSFFCNSATCVDKPATAAFSVRVCCLSDCASTKPKPASRAKPAASAHGRKRQVLEAVRAAADELSNTPAICRKSYVHDTIVTAFEDGILERFAATMKGYRSQSKREQLLAQVVATAAA